MVGRKLQFAFFNFQFTMIGVSAQLSELQIENCKMTPHTTSPPHHPATSPPHHLIFLIGYRGTGKTTVAQLVAERLGWKWIDADEVFEARQGRSIGRIFAEEGEAGFRLMESVLLEEFCRQRQHVVATGGGVVLNKANRDRMRAAGLVVWLTADARSIHERLLHDPSTGQRRPPLTVGGLAEIEQLLLDREPLYRECANLAIDTNNRSPEGIAEEIVKACGK